MPPRTFLVDLLQESTVPVTNQKTTTILVRIRLYKFEGTVNGKELLVGSMSGLNVMLVSFHLRIGPTATVKP